MAGSMRTDSVSCEHADGLVTNNACEGWNVVVVREHEAAQAAADRAKAELETKRSAAKPVAGPIGTPERWGRLYRLYFLMNSFMTAKSSLSTDDRPSSPFTASG